MNNVLIINAHEPYPFSEGRLNKTLVDIATTILQQKGYEVDHSSLKEKFRRI